MKLRGGKTTRAFTYAAFWLLLAGLAYAIFDAVVSPNVASAVAVDGSGEVLIDRSYDQHFYVAGAINGHPVTFMVDTGASVVSVSADLARKIGLPAGAPAVFETFGGRIAGRMVVERFPARKVLVLGAGHAGSAAAEAARRRGAEVVVLRSRDATAENVERLMVQVEPLVDTGVLSVSEVEAVRIEGRTF